jgi:hypothetical protein
MIKHNIKSITADKKLNESLSAMIAVQAPLKTWLATAKTGYVDCKRRSLASGLSEFKKLYNVKEFYMQYPEQNNNWKDDSIEIKYTVDMSKKPVE